VILEQHYLGCLAHASYFVADERSGFAVHDAEALDLPRRRFDLALCGWSL
jgi:hypothetical protein